MDTGVQLGRRFRALKLWMVLRYFGADGIRERLEEHIRLARLFASWVDASPMFERAADVPFSVVCFRCRPTGITNADEINRFNASLMEAVNQSGEIFLSHTKLGGRFVIRLAVGDLPDDRASRAAGVGPLAGTGRTTGAGIIHPLVRWTPALGDKAPAFRSESNRSEPGTPDRVSGSRSSQRRLQPSAVAVAASVACVRRAARAPAPRAA